MKKYERKTLTFLSDTEYPLSLANICQSFYFRIEIGKKPWDFHFTDEV